MGGDPAVELTETITATLTGIQGLVLGPEAAAAALTPLTQAASELIPLAVGAGITVVDERGACTTIAATGPVVVKAQALQCELGEGPCLRAWDRAALQYIEDTVTDARWSDWCSAAVAAGVRSALSVPVVFQDRELGALTVYAGEPYASTEYEEHLLGLLAAAAAPLVMVAGTGPVWRRLSSSLVATVEAFGRMERAVGVLSRCHHLKVHRAQARARVQAATGRLHQSLAQVLEDLLHDPGPPPPDRTGPGP